MRPDYAPDTIIGPRDIMVDKNKHISSLIVRETNNII